VSAVGGGEGEDAGVDLLAIGPHPDDVELFCGGTVGVLARRYRVVILDLTRGERASNGTPELRAEEALAAAEVLGVARRDNLGLPDGGIHAHDAAQVAALVAYLRRWRPRVVMAPLGVERHPDHAEAGGLVERAVFFAGVAGAGGARHRVDEVMYYPMRVEAEASFAVDVSAVIDLKRRAVACHASQVGALGVGPESVGPAGRVATMVSDPRSAAALEARERMWGARIGVDFAEPFVVHRTLAVDDPVAFLAGRPRPVLFPERRR
jgi:bacillithiol biosynthesis deacetylase BshB1